VPSTIWTPRAVASKAATRQLRLWRAVEAQHVASTRRLTDNVDEQSLLEDLLERAKPPLPPAALKLHYLLATPFRYPTPFGSRFRAASDPPAWYGTEVRRTACAELGYWRWRLMSDSAGLNGLGPSPQTLFQAKVAAITIDLDEKPFARDRSAWMQKNDYGATQEFARSARAAAIGVIRYRSVRDPQIGYCGAVLTPQAFASPRPVKQETWFLTVSRSHVTWQRDENVFEFSAADF
jgi:hypothetical protein